MGLALSVRELVVEGDRGRRLLRIGALDIPAGGRVGVRGPSGAGKSTFLYAIAGLVAMKAGTVTWDDETISAMNASQRARFRRERVGMIFQDFLLFEELPALGNAALAAGYAGRAERGRIADGAAAMLAHLGLGDHADRAVDTFSGGERQRVAVARALAADPPIILADEPTASLDRAAADRLIGDLADLAETRGKTLIAVSHDATLHERMDRVIDIVDGCWTGEG
ncbi:MAG: ABC transporter ATP-binding protein [Ahrensia sp.]|nr:ABC transporter ATP-binding protein [Ahrensia sp.]|tara:strand:+ start:9433 stop:10107 length:675 start_codon:yes stop_codon:yes gene_type:complete